MTVPATPSSDRDKLTRDRATVTRRVTVPHLDTVSIKSAVTALRLENMEYQQHGFIVIQVFSTVCRMKLSEGRPGLLPVRI